MASLHTTFRTESNCFYRIKYRCFKRECRDYKNYGGRGITVCSGWKNSFSSFLKDVGTKPSPDLSIDRIDNNGNYSCGKCEECIENGWKMNVHWGTRLEQMNNQRRTRLFTFNGKTQSSNFWAEELGINPYTLGNRKANGWSDERALTTPVNDKTHQQKKTAKSIEFDGKSMSIYRWSKIVGIRFNTIDARLKKGWSVKDALTIPANSVRKYSKRKNEC